MGLGVNLAFFFPLFSVANNVVQVLILGFPIQFFLVRIMFMNRRKGVKVTDNRVRLTTEVWSHSFYNHDFRGLTTCYIIGPTGHPTRESIRMGGLLCLSDIQFQETGNSSYPKSFVSAIIFCATFYLKNQHRVARAALISLVTFIPVLASVLSFVRLIMHRVS